jgi:hypothetical protein
MPESQPPKAVPRESGFTADFQMPRIMNSGRCLAELSGLPVQTLPLRVLGFLAANQLNGRENAQVAHGREASSLPRLFAADLAGDRSAKGGS